ncbi:MAG: hypothetical protein ABIU54_09065 [Candidatus Eisenbacteria bacterium]
MADDKDRYPDDWGNGVAKRAFLFTLILAALYVASVIFYVLR